jgi:hypothetical protein
MSEPHLTGVAPDLAGWRVLYGGLDSQGHAWREETPVAGWGLLESRGEEDGTPCREIVALVPFAETPGYLIEADAEGFDPVCLIPPNPTPADRERAEAAYRARIKTEKERAIHRKGKTDAIN